MYLMYIKVNRKWRGKALRKEATTLHYVIFGFCSPSRYFCLLHALCRAVLAAGCTLLHSALKSTSACEDDKSVIILPAFTVGQVQEFLRVLYGRCTRFISVQVARVAKDVGFR